MRTFNREGNGRYLGYLLLLFPNNQSVSFNELKALPMWICRHISVLHLRKRWQPLSFQQKRGGNASCSFWSSGLGPVSFKLHLLTYRRKSPTVSVISNRRLRFSILARTHSVCVLLHLSSPSLEIQAWTTRFCPRWRSPSFHCFTCVASGLRHICLCLHQLTTRSTVTTATPKRRQKWLFSKRRQTQTTPTVLVTPI